MGARVVTAAVRDLLQQQTVALRLRLRGDPVERLRDAEVGQPGGDHAEGVGPPLHEAARDGVRLEPGLGDRRLDRATGLGSHVGAPD